MDRQKIIKEIYAKIADKTLSFWCNIIRINWIEETVVKFDVKWDWSFYLVTLCSSNNTHYWVSLSLSDIENIIIIWHPITLTYVLYHLWRNYIYESWEIVEQKNIWSIDEYDNIFRCDWVLTKKTNYWNRDAMLDDQSDETIKAIREIICKCDHVGDWVVYMTNPAQYKCKKCWEMFK